MRRFSSKLAIAGLLVTIVILFNWKLLLTRQYTWVESHDNLAFVVPSLQEQARDWHGGHFPIWNPFTGVGQPNTGQIQTGTLNPLNWILFSMPFRDSFIPLPVLHWYWAAIQLFGVLFAYLLCRDLRMSRAASILGGCAFGLGGFIGGVGQPQMMMSALLLPLTLMFFLRVLRGDKPVANAATSGALLGASFLSGHLAVPAFFALTMVGLWIYHFATDRRKALGPAAAFFACATLIAATQILPATEFSRLSIDGDQKVEYSVHDENSLLPSALLGTFLPGFDHGSAIFIGIVIVTLALLGAVARWQERSTRVLAAISVAGLFVAIGAHEMIHGVLYAVVPYLDKTRAPNMAVAIFQLGTVVLAAYGLDSFRSASGEHRNRIAIRNLAGAAVLIYAALIVLISVRTPQAQEYQSLGEAAIVALLFAAILHAWNRSHLSNRWAAVLVILLLLFELNNVTNARYAKLEAAAGVQTMTQDRDIAGFLKQMRPPVRVEVDEKEIAYGFGDWFGIPALNSGPPPKIKAVALTMNNAHSRELFAANYYIGRTAKRAGQIDSFESQRGIKIFADPNAMPYARLVHSSVGLANEDQVIAAVEDEHSDLRQKVFVEGTAPALDTCDGGDAQLEAKRSTSLVAQTNSPCRAMLVIADLWYPGWSAKVDGKPAKIWKAYGVIRGVVVDAGHHQVVMGYRPARVFIGGALGALGIALCLLLRRWPFATGWRGIHFSHHLHPLPHRRPHS